MTWIGRNRVWLILIVPLLLIAMGVSSFRLVTLYLPWQWSDPVVVKGSEGHFEQTFVDVDGVKRHRSVDVEVVSTQITDEFEGVAPVEGAVMWQVVLEFNAEPDQYLYGCEVELSDKQGNRYSYAGGLEASEPDGFYLTPYLLACVPEDAPGPRAEVLGEQIGEVGEERPLSWRQTVLIATPQDVVPTKVRIGWSKPVYLVLDVPQF